MTEQDKFELNRWLWLNVFGWVDFREEEYPHRSGYALGSDEGEKCLEADMLDYLEPANALDLLKKCAEHPLHLGQSISLHKGVSKGKYYIASEDGYTAIGDTLELAICLFAKKLFTKAEL